MIRMSVTVTGASWRRESWQIRDVVDELKTVLDRNPKAEVSKLVITPRPRKYIARMTLEEEVR